MSRDRTTPSLTVAELGQVLTQGVILYRTNWRTYLQLSLQAYAWLLVPIYGWNRYLALSGVIARLGLAQLNQEAVTPKQINAELKRCGFKFFWLSLRIAWRIYWISTLFCTLALMPLVILMATLNLELEFNPANLYSASSLIFLLSALTIYLFPIWPYGKLFLAEIPLSISPEKSLKESLVESRKLIHGKGWKVIGLILTTLMLSAPVATLISQLPSFLWNILSFSLGASFNASALLEVPLSSTLVSSSAAMVLGSVVAAIYFLPEAATGDALISIGLNLISLMAAAIAILPLWQLVKSTLYYKLLCNQEGIDLKLAARSQNPAIANFQSPDKP